MSGTRSWSRPARSGYPHQRSSPPASPVPDHSHGADGSRNRPGGRRDQRAGVDAASSWTVYHGDPLGTGRGHLGRHLRSAEPGVGVTGLRRPGLQRAARGHRAWCLRGDGERHRLCAGRQHRSRCRGPLMSGPRCRRVTSPAGTSARQVGITGTPVVDAARGEIFAVADELAGRCARPFPRGDQHVQRDRRPGRGPSTRPTGARPPSCSAPV